MKNRFYRSYLPLKFHIWLWIVGLFFMIIFSSVFFLLFLLIHLLFLLLFRKFSHFYKEVRTRKDEVLFSPVNGTITSVRKSINHDIFGNNLSEIRIVIPWWKEFGVFLPKTAEVKDLILRQGKPNFRYSWPKAVTDSGELPAGHYLELETFKDGALGLHFSRCPLGMMPEIFVLPGDRGKNIANIGYFPFGGTVHFYFPENFEILVQVGQNVEAGESLIAGTVENH